MSLFFIQCKKSTELHENSVLLLVCPPGLEPGPKASEAFMVSNSTTGTFLIFIQTTA